MGGYGSGQWQSWGAKDTIESTKCLDIFRLRKIIPLGASYCIGQLTWGSTSCISYQLNKDQIILDYKFTSGHYEGEALRYAIPLVTTHPHYGGVRYWFSCPSCWRRVGKLYLARKRFECRGCARLAYESTRAGRRDLIRMIEACDRRAMRSSARAGEESMEFALAQLGGLVANLRYQKKYGEF
jgi:hypothetical protein